MLTKRDMLWGGAIALGIMLATGIWREIRPDPLAGRAEHSEGISVSIPDGFEVRRPAGALALVESGDLRSPRSIRIDVVRTKSIHGFCHPSCLARETRNGRASYYIDDVGIGPGGTHWRLTAAVGIAGLEIHIRADLQTEGDPNFDFVWDVVDSIH